MHIVWKLLEMSHFTFWILAFSTIFVLLKKHDLSGNIVGPQASIFKNSPKLTIFDDFFVDLKCKRSSLRSQS